MTTCHQSRVPLAELDVLVVDCQATGAAPDGHLLEIGWSRTDAAVTHTRLIKLPAGAARLLP